MEIKEAILTEERGREIVSEEISQHSINVSLHPLKLDEAVSDLLQVKPESKQAQKDEENPDREDS